MKLNRLTLTLVLILIAQIAVLGGKFLLRSDGPGDALLGKDPRAKGNPSGGVRIIEYADFQCGACQRAFFYLENLFEKHADHLYLKSRYFPLTSHAHGLRSATYAECAARQNRYWPYHHALFVSQPEWSRMKDPEPVFKRLGEESGLDPVVLNSCLADPSVTQMILDEKQKAREFGVNQTPSFFVNGKFVVGYKGILEEMQKIFGHDGAQES